MLRLFHSSTTSVGLLALILLFVLLVALIVVFSQAILLNLATGEQQSNLVIYMGAVALPAILLGLIVFQIVRLIRQRGQRRSGARLKSRLLLFFVVIALLSSLPQALLSVSFIRSAINFWLEARIGEALRGGLSISLEYYRGMAENLRSFGESSLLPAVLQDLNRNPERLWKNVRTINSQIQFIQVFDSAGQELLFRGAPEGRLRALGGFDPASGDLPKEEGEQLSILRNASVHAVGGESCTVVVGLALPEGFDQKAQDLTESLQRFTQLNRYKQLFRLVLTVFYFFFSAPIFLISILVSFLLTEEIIRPIVSLEEATRRVAEGDFSFRILSRSADELSLLVGSFNRMVAELAYSREKLRQTEKITAWQEIAQRLAHEIKNPLTPIKLAAQRILKKYSAEASSGAGGSSGSVSAEQAPKTFGTVLESSVAAIVREVDNLDQLLRDFRELARLPAPAPERLGLRELVQEVAATYAEASAGISIDCSHMAEGCSIVADRGQMKQVFTNLIKNAIQAMPGGGRIVIRSATVDKAGRRYCRIWVRDSGEGIPEEIRERIYEPYFTTKKEGTGLGLAIVQRIVFDHDGSIWFETQQGVGTTFVVDLPAEA
jgi:two-component system nitrogen regulation sensor histidine kinase NtrY